MNGIMGISARFLLARQLNGTSTYEPTAAATAGDSSATLGLIQELVFAESKSVRTSTIILAAFNVLASFTTAVSILYDCYWASKRCNPKFKASKFCVSKIHPAETFPLVLSIGIVVQGLTFAGVQGTGLKSLHNESGCGFVAQFLWPALFIVPYIQLVFGLECAIRSMRRLPFQARGKYDVTICLGVIVLMLIITWIPSHIFPEDEGCFASLVWFISRYGKLGLILLSVSTGLIIISTLTIFTKLSGAVMIEEDQRIAASRMVYYLVLGMVSMAFVLPYFISQTINGGDLKTSMMATVVLNLSGLMNGVLQLFLRSNTASTSFGPRSKWTDRNKHEIRIWGPNEAAFGQALRDPVQQPYELSGTSAPRGPSRGESTRGLTDEESRPQTRATQDSRRSSVGEKGRIISLDLNPQIKPPMSKYNPLASNAPDHVGTFAMPTIPEPAAASNSVTSPRSPTRGHARKPSYTIFPNDATSPTKSQTTRQAAAESVYDISDLLPPPVIHFPGSSRHRRDSSMNTIASTATVQIGLRLSHAPSPTQEDMKSLPLSLPQTTYGVPIKRSESPTLQIQTQNLSPIRPPPRSPLRPQPSPLANISSTMNMSPESKTSPESMRSPERDIRMKTLPPTPRIAVPQSTQTTQPANPLERLSVSNGTLLSPAVYKPEPSPLRNNSLSRSNSNSKLQQTIPQRSNSQRSDRSLRSPPPMSRSNSNRNLKEEVKDWI